MNTVKVFENRKVKSVWEEEDLETELSWWWEPAEPS